MDSIEVLNDEKRNILSEILECVVCFELPIGKQVKICEEGHHFCETCHKNMSACGVCRGSLLETRNFVVEQLLTKLAPVLNKSGSKLPSPEQPPKLTKGLFNCLHQCSTKLPAGAMLTHLRAHHLDNLVEDVRSDPFSGKFSLMFDIKFLSNDKFILSVHVSDMGLFTVDVSFTESNFFGYVKMLGDKSVTSLFRYQLGVKISNSDSDSSMGFSITNSTVLSPLDDIKLVKEEKKGLKIKGEALLEAVDLGSKLSVFFSVWRYKKSVGDSLNVICLPEEYLVLKNDRRMRRNRNRNMRRKRLKESLLNDSFEITETVVL